MSRVYFHAPHRDAEVRGSERAYFNGVCNDIALALLNPNGWQARQEIESLLVNPADYLAKIGDDREWARAFETWFSVGDMTAGESGFRVGDSVIPASELALNTAIALNSPQIAFMAHVHGLCESHIWIEAENAGWMADLIAKGREDNVFRAGQGWEDVIGLAREVEASGDGPIVLSYSVCEQFPDAYTAGWEPPTCEACGGDGKPNPRMKYTDDDYDYCTTCDGQGALRDAWYDLPEQERWDVGVRALREGEWPFAMGPDRQGQGFLSGKSIFDIKAERWTGRLAPNA